MLISSLRDKQKYKRRSFKALYFKRWPIEGKYEEAKKKLERENCSGIPVDTIREDFYAAMTLTNITAVLHEEVQEVGKMSNEGRETNGHIE